MNPQQIAPNYCPNCQRQISTANSACLCGFSDEVDEEATVARFPDLKLVPAAETPEIRFLAADELDEFSEAFDELVRNDNETPVETEAATEVAEPILEVPAASPPADTFPSFQTYVERPSVTPSAVFGQPKPPARPFTQWLRSASLVGVAAFGGGLAVYMFTPSNVPPSTIVGPSETNTGVTDLLSSDAFVSRSSSGTPADEPLLPEDPSVTEERKERPQANPATSATGPQQQPIANTETEIVTADTVVANSDSPANSTSNSGSDKEAKVGSYVAEKPAGRKPTARCADGTFSYSASGSSACAQRGGVSEWLGEGKAPSKSPAPNVAYILGPKGGCYYLSKTNEKIYVDKKHCN